MTTIKLMTLRMLENEIRANGFTYKILKRKDKIALVEVLEIDKKTREIEQNGYEVWVIRTIPITEHDLEFRPRWQGFAFYEKAPTNADFGQYGWYFISKERAEACFAEKVEKYTEVMI